MPFETPPRLGLGTFRLEDPETCASTVEAALELGYRHIDTAQGYENEAAVGRGLAAADVEREAVFLATKVSTGNLAYEDVLESTEESLDRLGVESVDLLYIHWPLNTYDPEGTLAAFDELYASGKIDHVGVSNFEPRHLDEARERLEAPIFANQIELHPMLPQRALRAYAREHDHWVVAYSPIARNRVADVPELVEIARKHDATPAQVSLAWLRSLDRVAAIPKATGEHVAENLAGWDLELEPEDIERIERIDRTERVVDFDAAPWNTDADADATAD